MQSHLNDSTRTWCWALCTLPILLALSSAECTRKVIMDFEVMGNFKNRLWRNSLNGNDVSRRKYPPPPECQGYLNFGISDIISVVVTKLWCIWADFRSRRFYILWIRSMKWCIIKQSMGPVQFAVSAGEEGAVQGKETQSGVSSVACVCCRHNALVLQLL
jgi:hypothetical protein